MKNDTPNQICWTKVYTTDLNKDAKKAVLVWFPSGGFNAGSGDDDMYGPDFFMDQDVVLVTLNHRLGAIGKNLSVLKNVMSYNIKTFRN